MTDNELFELILPLINDGLLMAGFLGITVMQSYQPTQQGIPENPILFINKTGDRRYGFPQRYSEWDGNQEIHYESQWYETDFKIGCLFIQNPEDTTQPTASDVANIVAGILQSDNTLFILQENNVGILRIQNLDNPYFIDDKQRFEASPTFNITLTHQRDTQTIVPEVTTIESGIFRI